MPSQGDVASVSLCVPICEVGGQSAFLGSMELMPTDKGARSLVAAAWSVM